MPDQRQSDCVRPAPRVKEEQKEAKKTVRPAVNDGMSRHAQAVPHGNA